MYRLVLLCLLCACTALDTEEQDRLAAYQRRAQTFFEGGKFGQAMIQIERGLELEPDDYKLNSLKGGVLLLNSGDVGGTDHKKLDEATAVLERQYATRSPDRHEPHLLLNYGLALQKQGLRHLGEAVRLDGRADRAPAGESVADTRAAAAAERALSTELLDRANGMLGQLVARGELLRIAHNHRLQIALQRGDDQAFVAESQAYFEQARKAEEVTRQRIEETSVAGYEVDQMAVLRSLRDEEIGVRTLVAEFHYARRQFEAAKVQLDRVLELDPRRFVDYYNRGRVLLELGRPDEAKADFRRFLADPSIPSTSEKAVFALKAIDR